MDPTQSLYVSLGVFESMHYLTFHVLNGVLGYILNLMRTLWYARIQIKPSMYFMVCKNPTQTFHEPYVYFLVCMDPS